MTGEAEWSAHVVTPLPWQSGVKTDVIDFVVRLCTLKCRQTTQVSDRVSEEVRRGVAGMGSRGWGRGDILLLGQCESCL